MTPRNASTRSTDMELFLVLKQERTLLQNHEVARLEEKQYLHKREIWKNGRKKYKALCVA